MNHPTFPSFCEVCREAIVLALYRRIRLVEAFRPGVPTLTIRSAATPQVFELDLLQPPAHSLAVQWCQNGVPVLGATSSTFNLLPQTLSAGAHTLSAVVRDATPFVRSDAAALLTQSVSWQIQITRLNLDGSLALPDGSFVFHVSGSAPFGFVVQSSSDLRQWQSLSTNSLNSGHYWVTNPPTFGKQQFFRVLCLESSSM